MLNISEGTFIEQLNLTANLNGYLCFAVDVLRNYSHMLIRVYSLSAKN